MPVSCAVEDFKQISVAEQVVKNAAVKGYIAVFDAQ